MEGAASANEGTVLPEAANGSKDAEEAAANQQRDGGLAAANEDAPLQGSANERNGRCSSANQDAEMQKVTNDSKEPAAANEDPACKSPANEDSARNASTNQDSGHKSPANQDTATPSTNQKAAPRPNKHQAPPLQDPTNDLTPLAAAANQAWDPWDWSLEEAWLRAPDEEGLAAWGAELEGWEVEPEDEEAELEDWEVELENCGVEPAGQGVEPKHSKGKGEELEHSKDQGMVLKAQGVGLKSQGEELGHSKGEEVGLNSQGAGLKSHGAELKHCGVDPGTQGVELKAEGAESKGQGVELKHYGEDPKAQRAEFRPEGAWPCPPEAGHWQPSPDGAWSKLTVRPGRGLARPGPGSLCRVHLSEPRSGRCPWGPPAAASGCGRWRSVRLGSAEGRWSSLLDAALESMARGELAWLRPRGVDSAALIVRLGPFTPPPPFWTVPLPERWRSVRSGHARAAQLLAAGLVSAAGRAFRRSLRAAAAAAGPPPLSPAVSELKAELHAGLAEVQLRLGHAAAAAANAGKALELRPAHLGARYARGVASAAMMDLELAREDLLAVLRARPGHAGASRELGRVRSKARQRDTQLATRLGKMFA